VLGNLIANKNSDAYINLRNTVKGKVSTKNHPEWLKEYSIGACQSIYR
jgi:hypothetical protein